MIDVYKIKYQEGNLYVCVLSGILLLQLQARCLSLGTHDQLPLPVSALTWLEKLLLIPYKTHRRSFDFGFSVLSPSSSLTSCSALPIAMSAFFGVEKPLYHTASLSAHLLILGLCSGCPYWRSYCYLWSRTPPLWFNILLQLHHVHFWSIKVENHYFIFSTEQSSLIHFKELNPF